MLFLGCYQTSLGQHSLIVGGEPQMFLQLPLLPAQGLQGRGGTVCDVEGGHPVTLGVEQVQGFLRIGKGNAFQMKNGLNLLP